MVLSKVVRCTMHGVVKSQLKYFIRQPSVPHHRSIHRFAVGIPRPPQPSTHLDILAVLFLERLDVRICGLHYGRAGNLNGPVVLICQAIETTRQTPKESINQSINHSMNEDMKIHEASRCAYKRQIEEKRQYQCHTKIVRCTLVY